MKTSTGAVIHLKKDLTAAPTWAKGGSGPTFADMVRQKATEKAPPTPAAAEAPAQPADPTPVAEPVVKTPAKTPTPAPADAPAEPPAPEVVGTPAAVSPSQPPQSEPPAAPQPVPELVIIEEPVAPAPSIPPYYVLEVERVDRVKLPVAVVQAAAILPGMYTFSAQAGKPPTPPLMPVQTPATLYRADAANLVNRQWTLASDARLPPQQHWNPTGSQPVDYWTPAPDRGIGQRFQHSQMQYNSYPVPAPTQPPLRGPNFFPSSRLRPGETPEASLRPSAPFNRSSAANGGGVW